MKVQMWKNLKAKMKLGICKNWFWIKTVIKHNEKWSLKEEECLEEDKEVTKIIKVSFHHLVKVNMVNKIKVSNLIMTCMIRKGTLRTNSFLNIKIKAIFDQVEANLDAVTDLWTVKMLTSAISNHFQIVIKIKIKTTNITERRLPITDQD